MADETVTKSTNALTEYWKVTREIIEHEDNLTNHRLTWYFTLQGFLFTALALGANGLVNGINRQYHPLIFGILVIISIAGIISGLLIIPSLHAAVRQLNAVRIWWTAVSTKKDVPIDDSLMKFPPLRGHAPRIPIFREADVYPDYCKPEDVDKIDRWSSYSLPHLFCICWFLIICLLSCFYFHPAATVANPEPATTRPVTIATNPSY